MKVFLGKKLNMTQIFTNEGESQAVTVIKTVPTEFHDRISEEKRGYSAIVCKVTDGKKEKLVEFRSSENDFFEMKKGDKFDESQFQIGDIVVVTGTSKGKGFSGTIKRYGFAQGPKTHGSNQQRRVGSIGAAYPQHVLKGQKMPGRMGNDQITVKNLKVVDVDNKNHLLLVAGAIPGNNGSQIKIVSK
jgi:large subunit ribosomal protein L3